MPYYTKTKLATIIENYETARDNILTSQELHGPNGRVVRAQLKEVEDRLAYYVGLYDQVDSSGEAGAFINKVQFQDPT